jgi:hypothetical protein
MASEQRLRSDTWGSRGPGFKSRQPDAKVHFREGMEFPCRWPDEPSPRNPRATPELIHLLLRPEEDERRGSGLVAEVPRASHRRRLRWRDTRRSRSRRKRSGAISRRYRGEPHQGAGPLPSPSQAKPGTLLPGTPSQGVRELHGLLGSGESHPPAGVGAVVRGDQQKP